MEIRIYKKNLMPRKFEIKARKDLRFHWKWIWIWIWILANKATNYSVCRTIRSTPTIQFPIHFTHIFSILQGRNLSNAQHPTVWQIHPARRINWKWTHTQSQIYSINRFASIQRKNGKRIEKSDYYNELERSRALTKT